jgi:hypothetical protein
MANVFAIVRAALTVYSLKLNIRLHGIVRQSSMSQYTHPSDVLSVQSMSPGPGIALELAHVELSFP